MKKSNIRAGDVQDFLKKFSSLYEKPLPSNRLGALYNAFSYPTKISAEAIALFIASHTEPGDVVLDTFGGSGSTGLAALLCAKPTEDLKKMATELGINAKWGSRKAIIYEISALGAFVAKTMCRPPEPQLFRSAAEQLLARCEKQLSNVYSAIDDKGKQGKVRYAIWSEILICPKCSAEVTFWDSAVTFEPLAISEEFKCPRCKERKPFNQVERRMESYFDPLIKKTMMRKKRALVKIYGETGNRKWVRQATDNDKKAFSQVESMKLPEVVPYTKMEWGDLFRSGYHRGITHVHQFYTHRNLLVLSILWDSIKYFTKDVQDALRLLILSYNATHSTMMTRIVVKSKQKDFVLTGAQSGVLYISNLPIEKNIFDGLRRKIKVLQEAFETVYGSSSEVDICNRSSTRLNLKDKSVDYVFTDPPFGDYIPYAELNQINEAWLGKLTDRKEEAVISVAQNKTTEDYGRLMSEVFSEIGRVLKDEGRTTLVFHSAKASVWSALQEAYLKANLTVIKSSVLEKMQYSFKQVISTVAVKGDPMLLLVKAPLQKENKISGRLEVETAITNLLSKAFRVGINVKEQTVERLYSRFVSQFLEYGLPVPLDAEAFYSRIHPHLNKRIDAVSNRLYDCVNT